MTVGGSYWVMNKMWIPDANAIKLISLALRKQMNKINYIQHFPLTKMQYSQSLLCYQLHCTVKKVSVILFSRGKKNSVAILLQLKITFWIQFLYHWSPTLVLSLAYEIHSSSEIFKVKFQTAVFWSEIFHGLGFSWHFFIRFFSFFLFRF